MQARNIKGRREIQASVRHTVTARQPPGGYAVTNEERHAALRNDETSLWLCQGHGDGDHATLVRGWAAMVKMLASQCVDWEAPPEAVAEAEAWLIHDPDEWEFGSNGTAHWSISFEDGQWSATRVTDATAIAA